jgi:hypothetical protein
MLEAAGDKLRIKYKDKDIPETELVKFKVSVIKDICGYLKSKNTI